MVLQFEADKSFDVPEGIYSATLDEVREEHKITKDGVAKYARFLFKIDKLCTPSKIYMVGKNFLPTLLQGSDLRLMLETWLEEEFVEAQKIGGNWQIKALEGHKADRVIRHIKNKGHKKPFVYVEQILPHGKLIPIEVKVEKKETVEAAAKD